MGKKKKERRINVQWNQNMHILTKNGKKKKEKKRKTFPACLTKWHTVYCSDGADKGISVNLLRLILGHLGMTRQRSPYTKCDRQRNPSVEECIIEPPAIEEAINAWQPRHHSVAIAAFSFFLDGRKSAPCPPTPTLLLRQRHWQLTGARQQQAQIFLRKCKGSGALSLIWGSSRPVLFSALGNNTNAAKRRTPQT